MAAMVSAEQISEAMRSLQDGLRALRVETEQYRKENEDLKRQLRDATDKDRQMMRELAELNGTDTYLRDVELKISLLEEHLHDAQVKTKAVKAGYDRFREEVGAGPEQMLHERDLVVEERDRLKAEVKEQQVQHKHHLTFIRHLFAKVIRQVAGSDVKNLSIKDMQRLGHQYRKMRMIKSRLLPPRRWNHNSPASRAEFATKPLVNVKPRTGTFAYMLCSWLTTETVNSDIKTGESRRNHIAWLDSHLMAKFRRQKTDLKPVEWIELSCLFDHIIDCIEICVDDGVSFAWLACMLVQLGCIYSIDAWAEDIFAAIGSGEVGATNILEAASLLRLRMAALHLRDLTSEEAKPLPAFTRFPQPIIEMPMELCTLDMVSFLTTMHNGNILGKEKHNEWLVMLEQEEAKVVLVNDYHGQYIFARAAGSGETTFAKSEPTFDTFSLELLSGIVSWTIDGTRYEFNYKQSDDLYEYLYVFHRDRLNEVVIEAADKHHEKMLKTVEEMDAFMATLD